jgi:outer membrane protein, multidrug efflux system
VAPQATGWFASCLLPLASRLPAAPGWFASRLSHFASRLAAATLGLVAAACTVGPNYTKPQIDSPQAWRVEYQEAADIANTRWWEAFGDPALDQLVDSAVRENLDVQIAAARVDQFLGALRTTRSQFYPQFDYGADASANRASAVGQPPVPPGTDRNYELYTAALGASWQIDLFGRVRRQTEAAQAQVYASEQGRRGVILSVVTSVATGYIGLRALDRQLEIARATAANYGETLKLFELRRKGGVVSDVELAQIQSQYQQALAVIPSIERQVAVQENLLSILLGRNPGLIPRGMTIDQLIEPGIPGALPSSLLERRPDVLQAEQQLRAANAQIGVAKSLYYPTLSLTGVLGLASTSLGNFVSSDATYGTLAATLAGPIFTFGNIEGQVSSARAGERGALAFYRQVVLNAFRETNDALVGVQKRREEHAALAKRVVALQQYAGLSRLRFDNGVTGYLEVLYAENELFGAELNAVQASFDRYGEVINVYKAMGGGWVDLADPLARQPAPPPVPEASRAAAAAAGPGAATAASPAAGQDRTAVMQEGSASVLNVYRERGIGGVEVRAPRSGWPAALIVRFHGFPGLESFTARTATISLLCQTHRPEGRPPEDVCTLNGATVEVIRKSGDQYDVSLPASMLTPDTAVVEVRWVDQWR